MKFHLVWEEIEDGHRRGWRERIEEKRRLLPSLLEQSQEKKGHMAPKLFPPLSFGYLKLEQREPLYFQHWTMADFVLKSRKKIPQKTEEIFLSPPTAMSVLSSVASFSKGFKLLLAKILSHSHSLSKVSPSNSFIC